MWPMADTFKAIASRLRPMTGTLEAKVMAWNFKADAKVSNFEVKATKQKVDLEAKVTECGTH